MPGSLALAIDLGGTKLAAALVDADGRVIEGARSRRPTGRGIDPNGLREALAVVVAETLERMPEGGVLAGTGVGSAGPVDLDAGTVSPLNMPALAGFPLRDEVASILREAGMNVHAAATHAGAMRRAEVNDTGVPSGIPAVLALDGACIALAEAWVGATRGARASLSIVVSTGIGGGFVFDGRPFTGATGNAGHIGQLHLDVPGEGPGDLTLEQIASGPASVLWARSRGWDGDTGEQLGNAAAAGDTTARAAIERSADAVGHALVDTATLVDLDVIAIGGGFSFASADYVDLVAASFRSRITHAHTRRVRIVRAGCAGDGPLIGAAALVL